MADAHRPEGIMRDVATLYELSLSIGQTLEARACCEDFLRRLMLRQRLGLAAVWARPRPRPGAPSDAPRYELLYACPRFRVVADDIAPGHPVAGLIERGAPGWARLDDPLLAGLLRTTRPGGGALVFPLEGLGVLLLASGRWTEPQSGVCIRRLQPLVRKFACALEGCLAHEQALREIRERVEAEGALRRSEERYRQLIETAADAILTLDLDRLEVVDVNPAAERLFGRSRGLLVGARLQSLVPAGEGAWTEALVREQARGAEGGAILEGVELRSRAGKTIPVEVGVSLLERDGHPLLLCVLRDTRERARVRLDAGRSPRASLPSPDPDPDLVGDLERRLASMVERAAHLQRELTDRPDLHRLAEDVAAQAQGASALFGRLLAGTKAGDASPPTAPADRRRVLFVDDHQHVRRMAEKLLAESGFDVLIAGDGAEAIEVFSAASPSVDVVILDLMMPRLSGRETFARLRALDPGCRVLISTGYARDEEVADLLAAGAAGFVRKPYQLDQLLATLERALS